MRANDDPGRPADETIRVLVVDDSDEFRRLVAAAVVALGHEVVGEAADGLSAIAAAVELDPDVVVMDWQMPRMDGVSATAAIRDRRPSIAIIGHSTATGAEVARAFMRAGACAFVNKADHAGLLAQLQNRGDGARASADGNTPRTI